MLQQVSELTRQLELKGIELKQVLNERDRYIILSKNQYNLISSSEQLSKKMAELIAKYSL